MLVYFHVRKTKVCQRSNFSFTRLFSIKKQKCSAILLSLGFCLIEEILYSTLIPLKCDLFCVLEPHEQSLVTPEGE